MERFRNFNRLPAAALIGGLVLTGCTTVEGRMPEIDMSNKAMYWPGEDCPLELPEQNRQLKQEQLILQKYRQVPTATGSKPSTSPDHQNLSINTENVTEVYTNLKRNFTHTVYTSEEEDPVDVIVKSDSPYVHIDAVALQQIFMLPIRFAESFKSDGLRHQMQCYQLALESGAVTASPLAMYVPSDPDLCFTEDQELVSREVCASQQQKGKHTYAGITLPQIFEYRSDLFEISHRPPLIVVGAHEDCVTANERINRTLLHEVMHYWQWTFEAPLRNWQAIEQYAYSTTDEMLQILNLSGEEVPQAIRFTNPTYCS